MAAIKIGTGTGVKWAQLDPDELPSEIKNRLRGGAKNPNGRIIANSRRYVGRLAPASRIEADIKAIPDERKREYATHAFDAVRKLFPQPSGELVRPKTSPPFDGPLKLLRVGTKPHLVMRDGRHLRHFFFWANLKPLLLPKGAQMGALLMRQYCETEPGRINMFEVVDLRAAEHYAFEADELDADPSALNELVRYLENEVSRLP